MTDDLPPLVRIQSRQGVLWYTTVLVAMVVSIVALVGLILTQQRDDVMTEERFDQSRCEDAYRREVERSEAVALAALSRALDAPVSDAAWAAFDETTRRLGLATSAQDAYADAGRPLPCPLD